MYSKVPCQQTVVSQKGYHTLKQKHPHLGLLLIKRSRNTKQCVKVVSAPRISGVFFIRSNIQISVQVLLLVYNIFPSTCSTLLHLLSKLSSELICTSQLRLLFLSLLVNFNNLLIAHTQTRYMYLTQGVLGIFIKLFIHVYTLGSQT